MSALIQSWFCERALGKASIPPPGPGSGPWVCKDLDTTAQEVLTVCLASTPTLVHSSPGEGMGKGSEGRGLRVSWGETKGDHGCRGAGSCHDT